MRCPRLLGLMTRAKVMFALSPNIVRVMLPDDSEIDLVLIDCFTPPMTRKIQHNRWGTDEVYDKDEINPKGVAALKATQEALERCPTWTRVLIPTPKHDREWFRNLKPQTKQPGHLWLTEHETLSERLVSLGIATKTPPQNGSDLFDGSPIALAQEDSSLWSFSPN